MLLLSTLRPDCRQYNLIDSVRQSPGQFHSPVLASYTVEDARVRTSLSTRRPRTPCMRMSAFDNNCTFAGAHGRGLDDLLYVDASFTVLHRRRLESVSENTANLRKIDSRTNGSSVRFLSTVRSDIEHSGINSKFAGLFTYRTAYGDMKRTVENLREVCIRGCSDCTSSE